MSYLFKIFDSDKNGLLSQAEVVDVLNTFFSLISRNTNDGTHEKPDYSLEDIKNDVSNAFGDKMEISQKELFEVAEKSNVMQEFGMRLQTASMMSMMVGDCGLQ
jgi:Ca2+-binding EF-hand superfamily protein